MIFNKSICPDTKQSGVQFVLRIQSVNRIPIWRSFVTIKDSSETIRKKLRSLSTEVSSNNMLTTILRPGRQDRAREFFWRRALFGPANDIDIKRPKLAETDSSTLRQNTPVWEGKNSLLKMCIFDAVMTRKSRFYGEIYDIVVFGKIFKFFVV